jgi:hypothetical protein
MGNFFRNLEKATACSQTDTAHLRYSTFCKDCANIAQRDIFLKYLEYFTPATPRAIRDILSAAAPLARALKNVIGPG